MPRTVVVAALIAAYVALFYFAPLPELDRLSRAKVLGRDLLLFDETITSWCGDPAEFAVFDRLRALVPALALLIACSSTGWALLRLWRADRELTAVETIFFAGATGTSVVSLFTFGVGILGGLQQRILFLVPAAVAVLWGCWQLGRTISGQRADRESPGVEPCETDSRRWLWWGLPFVLAIVLGGTLTPVDFDVREYHLQVPKEFYQQGFIGFLPHNIYGNMPLGSEMLSLAAMSLCGDWWLGALVGKAVIALLAPITALGLLAAGKRYGGWTTGVVAALVYISIPWVTRVSALGLVEGVSALYLWATVYAALLWWRAAGSVAQSRLLLVGFMAGSAVACKYPNVVFVLLPSMLVIAARTGWREQHAEQGQPWRQTLAALLLFGLAAGVACGPWFIKNWWLTGNPTYPLAYQFFDGRTRTDELDEQWQRAHRPPGFGLAKLADSAANVAWRSSWLSPAVWPLALLGVLGACQRRMARGMAIYVAFVLAAWWLFTHRIDRFWVPIYPLLAFLGGLGFAPGSWGAWRWPTKSLLAVALSANLLLIVCGGGGDIAYFVSLDRLQHDETRVHYWHQYMNEHLSPSDVVLTVGDAEVFDLRMPVLYSTVFDRDQFEEWTKGRTAEEQRRALREHNVSHVAVHWKEIARYRSPGNYGFSDYVQPALLAALVEAQVLDPPLRATDPAAASAGYEVYPVHGASTPDAAHPFLPGRARH